MGGSASSHHHHIMEGTMISKNMLMIIMAGTMAILILGTIAGLNLEDKTMALAGTKTAVKGAIPPIDRNIPTTIQTATFALG
mgnify:CR=1 FL=1